MWKTRTGMCWLPAQVGWFWAGKVAGWFVVSAAHQAVSGRVLHWIEQACAS